ncbi:DUF4192 domain-containing protein [Streptomyces monashensis]|uniref:DUF4192 domain-containing protein n=1 Tax=Streptomyces monashensis TaxID=1678012 RepID=A0A1S2QDX2_9ACTN|nr:DUF4192 domain-containing protein [Streptomyces monashensis]OIK04348.1 hypothetical protein BIV23_17710 [Streptomyces monashensis]
MTNHGETTGPFENNDISGHDPFSGLSAPDTHITLRTPAELADALPYLLGYRPEDSMVLVALHDRESGGRFGGRARLGIPANEEDWEAAARQLAQGLVKGSERRGSRPAQMVAYVCQEPAPGESGRDVRRRLERLAQLLRTQCGDLDVPVVEALCIADGRYWSYCCPVEGCCPEDGSPMGLPGTSVLAAAATYAGIQVRGTLRELRARLQPWETSAALEQEAALDAAGMALVPRILDEASRPEVAEETLALAERVMRRFAAAAPVSGTHPADVRDDGLLAHDEAATVILGLQDRTTRDRAAAWMEGAEAGPALRLWRALARRCVGSYGEHAAAPLTLAGWVAWSTGDELEAREALAMALGADPDYLFARLLHQACNEGLDPEAIRRCLRTERPGSARAEAARQTHEAVDAAPGALPAVDGGTSGARAQPDGQVAEPASGTGARRRRRVRSLDGNDSRPAARAARTAGGGRRPTGSRPGPSAAEPSRPATRGPGGTRKRASDQGTTSATASGSGLREPEGDG